MSILWYELELVEGSREISKLRKVWTIFLRLEFVEKFWTLIHRCL